jgi:prepilin-type N-terminal cleavage/methylation domain-containing protein
MVSRSGQPGPRLTRRATRWTARRAGGFTLMEVLIAVSIIAILAAGAFFAYRGMGDTQRANTTRNALGNARAILNEFAAVAKLTTGPAAWRWDATTKTSADAVTENLNFWSTQKRTGDLPTGAAEPMPAPANVASELAEGKLDAWQLRNTQQAMNLIKRVPTAAKIIGSLPKESAHVFDFAPTALTPPVPDSTVTPAPLLVDAWSNPLLLVHGAGLTGLTAGGVSVPNTRYSPDRKPFWVSAGADGNFVTDDDNLYSFEN